MEDRYNPTREEMMIANHGYITMLPLQEYLKEFLLENGDGIVDMMERINSVDDTLDYRKVFLLVVSVFLRKAENI